MLTAHNPKSEWKIHSFHPVICIVDLNNPSVIYLTSQTNNWDDLIAIDLTEVGTFYTFLREVEAVDEEDKGRNPISIAIAGFE